MPRLISNCLESLIKLVSDTSRGLEDHRVQRDSDGDDKRPDEKAINAQDNLIKQRKKIDSSVELGGAFGHG